LIGGVWVELASGDTSRQDCEDLILIP